MKKRLLYLLILLVLLVPLTVKAAYIENYETIYTQPDGTKINIYTTGDEYFRYTHDKNGYVLITSKSGYIVYATLSNDGVVIPTSTLASNKKPNNAIKIKDIDLEKNPSLIHEYKKVKNYTTKQRVNKVYNSTGQTYNLKNLVVFISFNDSQEFTNETFINTTKSIMGITSHNNSVKTYVSNVSNGKVNIDSSIFQYNGDSYYSYKSNYDRSYYLSYNATTNSNGYSDEDTGYYRLHTLLTNAINSLPATTTSNVDGNGDGYIDNIIFIVAGSSSGIWSDVLWPHKWDLRAYGLQTTYGGATTSTYNLQFANDLSLSNVSVYTHEMIHSLGIDDYYRYYDNYNGDPVGTWDMMNINRINTYVNSYVRYNYGIASTGNKWVDQINTITKSGKYILNAATTSSSNISYLVKTSNANEFIQLEYRKKSSGYNNIYDANIYSTGLIVSRINKSCQGNRGSSSKPVCDEYFIYRPNDNFTYGNGGGGFGNLNNAAITPCTTSTCTNTKGTRSSTATLNNGALSLSNGTNSQVVVRNVTSLSDNNKITFEVFPKDDSVYLNYNTYNGITSETFKIIPTYLTPTTSTYKSSDTNVLTVDASGNVTLVGSGSANIIVTTGTEIDTCNVTVAPNTIDSINASMIDGKNIKVKFTSTGSIIKYEIYRSTNPDTGYTKIGETTTKEYIDNNFTFGQTYYYKIGIVATSNGSEINTIYNLKTSINTITYLPNKVTSINASLEDGNTALISYTKVDRANKYAIKQKDYTTGVITNTYVEGDSNTYIANQLTFGRKYSYQVAGCVYISSSYYCGDYSDEVFANTKDFLLDFTSSINLSVINANSIKIDFDNIDNATSYDIYRSLTKTGTYTKIKENHNSNTYTDENLIPNKTYYYKVAPVQDKNEKTYRGFISNDVSIKLNIPKVQLNVSSNNYNSTKITFNKIEGVTSYQIYYSTSKTGSYRLLKTTNLNSYIHQNLTFNKYYYYKVRSYVKTNSGIIYSYFSDISYTKTRINNPVVYITTNNNNSITLNFTKLSGASKYKIYMNDKLLTTTTYNTYKINNLSSNNTYNFKIYGVSKYNISGLTTQFTYNYNNINNKINDFDITSIVDNQIKVTIPEQNSIEGYALLKSTTSNGNYITTKISDDNIINYDLASYYNFYYKVASFNKIGNVYYYSILSDNKPFKLKENKLKTYINVIDNDSIKINYYKVTKASSYKIYEYKNNEYILLGKTSNNSYTINNLDNSKQYIYKIEAIDSKNNILDYSSVNYSFNVEKPNNINNFIISSVDNKTIKIEIDDENTQSYYEIYRSLYKTKNYTRVTTSLKKEINIKTNLNKTYYYKIRVFNKNNNVYNYSNMSSYKSYKLLPTIPKNIKTESNSYNSVKISFDKVYGATGYKIYYSKTSNGVYSLLKTTTANSYIHTNLKLGNKYYYKIKSYNKVGLSTITSNYSSSYKTVVVPNAPLVSLTTINKNTIKVSWTKSYGATGYKLYMLDNDDWTLINNNLSKSTFSYNVNNLTINNTYSFKIIPLYNSYLGKESSIKTTKLLPLIPNKFKATIDQNQLSKVNISWDTTDADGYQLFLEDNLISDLTNNSYNDYDLILNKTYKYSIRSYITKDNKKIYSNKIDLYYTPKVYAVTNIIKEDNYNQITISFNKRDCVDGVVLYRSTSSTGTYTKIGETTNTQLVIKTTTFGKKYYYKLVPYKIVNNKNLYGYETYFSYTVLPHIVNNYKAISMDYNKLQIRWNKDSYSSGYKIYYSTSKTGTYRLLKTTTLNYYNHNYLTFNKNYYYKVRAYKIINKKYIYGTLTPIFTNKTTINKPTNLTINRYNYRPDQNKISWNRVNGATGYYIYRSTDGINFNYLKTTKSLYTIDKDLDKNTGYYYKVKAYRTSSNKKYFSDYSTVKYLSSPLLPNYTMISSNEHKPVFYLSINNNGNKPMYILGTNAVITDSKNVTSRLYLYNDAGFKTNKTTLSSRIKKIIRFKSPNNIWYNNSSNIGFYFIYDGVKYASLYNNEKGLVYGYANSNITLL